MAETEARLVQPRHVILLVGLGLVLIFVTAFIYRLRHPGLTVTPRFEQSAMESQGMHGGEMDMNEIAALMGKMREDPDNPEILKILGEKFMHIQAYEQAMSFLQKAIMIQPSDVEALTMLGVSLFNLERYQEAAEQFQMVLSLAPDNDMAKFNLGTIYKYGLKEPDKAKEYFQAVVDSPNANEHIRHEAESELKGE